MQELLAAGFLNLMVVSISGDYVHLLTSERGNPICGGPLRWKMMSRLLKSDRPVEHLRICGRCQRIVSSRRGAQIELPL